MRKVGYILGICEADYIRIQKQALEQLELDTIVVEESTKELDQNDEILKEVIGVLEAGDKIFVYELGCLGKTIVQLGDFLEELLIKKIELVIVNKKTCSKKITDKLYMELIINVSDVEKATIRMRTTKGIEKARSQGRIGGRPKISEKTVKQIHYLYHNQSYTLREIAEECDVSLGTAYKYIHANEK